MLHISRPAPTNAHGLHLAITQFECADHSYELDLISASNVALRTEGG